MWAMTLQKTFRIKGKDARYPIVQGGMGIGISLHALASAVGRTGCVGTVSSAGLHRLTPRRLLKPSMTPVEAAAREIADTRADAGFAAINIMVAVQETYEASVQGAIEGGVDVIISGAGLPMNLPTLAAKFAGKKDHEVALVPIVSSARALQLICKRWDKQGYRPDAVVLEGPKAGGHLGWNYKQVTASGDAFLSDYDLLDVLLDPVLEVASAYPNDAGPIPVIVAGGIYDHADIVEALRRGAAAVKMGTRFAATEESGGTELFKRTIVEATQDDIVVADAVWGSPCGLPFRYIKTSPLAQQRHADSDPCFCICTTLMGGAGVDDTARLGVRGGLAKNCPEMLVRPPGKECPASGNANYTPIVTCGTEAHRVDRVMPTSELVDELLG